jgi:outer membrane lipoprotein-sorting protein
MRCIVFILASWTFIFGQIPSGSEILKRIDQNLTSESKIISSKMIIHGRRGNRTIESKSWIRGIDQAFTEYLAPAREKGIKMLKLGDQLWTYSPQTDRTIRISGHMLRQSVMGSDLSYEDYLEDPELSNVYNAEVRGDEVVNNQNCWILQLTSKKEDVAYYTRKIWVDQERFLVLKENLYAKSGKLLKTIEVKSVLKLNDRWYAEQIIFKDVLKSGKGTEFIIDEIEFNVPLAEHIFSKAALRK